MCIHSGSNDGFYGSLTTFEDRKTAFVVNMTSPFDHIYSAGAFADSHCIVLLLEGVLHLFGMRVLDQHIYTSIECTDHLLN